MTVSNSKWHLFFILGQTVMMSRERKKLPLKISLMISHEIYDSNLPSYWHSVCSLSIYCIIYWGNPIRSSSWLFTSSSSIYCADVQRFIYHHICMAFMVLFQHSGRGRERRDMHMLFFGVLLPIILNPENRFKRLYSSCSFPSYHRASWKVDETIRMLVKTRTDL